MQNRGGMPLPVWLDCDPGHDDAMAIILAGHSPMLKLLGLSTVAGNHTLEKVTQNALDMASAAGLAHIGEWNMRFSLQSHTALAVVAGLSKPLLARPRLCPEIHGDSGLDGPAGDRLLPLSAVRPREGKAPIVMFEAIQAEFQAGGGRIRIRRGLLLTVSEGPRALMAVTLRRLVCTGALSNCALLLLLYPEVVPMIEIVLMGGCLGIGNTGPVVEFNIQVDPEAAKVVFESGVPLTMVPLEVTHTVLATPEVLRTIAGSSSTRTRSASSTLNEEVPEGALGGPAAVTAAASAGFGAESNDDSVGEQAAAAATSPFRGIMVQLLMFFASTYRRVFGFLHPPLHDPCAVAFVIAPEIFKVEAMRVDIEVCSPLSYGQTVCDRWHTSELPKNCCVALAVDVPAFWDLMYRAIEAADTVSPLNV